MSEIQYEAFNLEKLVKLRINEINNKADWFKYEHEKKDDKNLVIFVPKLNYDEYNFYASNESSK